MTDVPWSENLAKKDKSFRDWQRAYGFLIEVVVDGIWPDQASRPNQLVRRYLYEELHNALMMATPKETPWWPDAIERLNVFEKFEAVVQCDGITALTRLHAALSSFVSMMKSDHPHD